MTSEPGRVADPREPVPALLRDLHTLPGGLSARESARRQVVYGPNELRRRRGRGWPSELAAQFTHPLALLLWLAAALALLAGTAPLGWAILIVIVLNAALAFAQERQAEKAVEALAAYLPTQATVVRDGERRDIPARDLVPGDLLIIEEGDRVSADARLVRGAIEVDVSALTGEALPALRSADLDDRDAPLLAARDLVFSGTSCTGGEAQALVFGTGMRTELGRIAALSERTGREASPLERQVKRVAWLIAAVAVGAGVAFLPLGTLLAGLPLADAFTFAIGLLVANVPEGLLPTITLALAMGVRKLAGRGAVVKRLSAVETLGSTTVICTDKTGTLTRNQMRVTSLWTPAGLLDREQEQPNRADLDWRVVALAHAMAACNNADVDPTGDQPDTGDPTEIALLRAAHDLDVVTRARQRETTRRAQYHFDPALRLMSTVDEIDGGLRVHTKGAPEQVLARATHIAAAHPDGQRPITARDRDQILGICDQLAGQGLRLLGVARRDLPAGQSAPRRRADVESGLALLGVVAMFDPPRPEVAQAVAHCHSAGVRLIVVTGDHVGTAVEIARRVGIGADRPSHAITGDELDAMSEAELDTLLRGGEELIFARSAPEAKLRIADALRAEGHIVAMTGDGVNDAPALRRADIGVAMGVAGTDVAREAATMVLTNDNFATIVAAVEAGRQVYDNVRKFILYIFAHATPEVVPFLIYALSGGQIPLPLTVLQILAIDLGTETLPALALGREPAEPGVMARPPRPPREGVISGVLLLRAWLLLGGVSAVLVMGVFFLTLHHGGWTPGAPVAAGTPLHQVWRQATTMTFLGIVACQIGTALAARTSSASLRSVGLGSNPPLLWGIGFEVIFAILVVYLEPLRRVFGTEPPPPALLAALLPFPLLVWGVDEVWRWSRRRERA